MKVYLELQEELVSLEQLEQPEHQEKQVGQAQQEQEESPELRDRWVLLGVQVLKVRQV